MKAPVSVQDKITFINWLSNNYRFKCRRNKWMLDYFMTDIELLTKVHFVKDFKACQRGLIISSSISKELSLLYFKGKIVTDDAEKIFHDIRFNNTKPLYIQLNFQQQSEQHYISTVIENNFFTYKKENNNSIEKIFSSSIYNYKKSVLKDKIDISLKNKDKSSFLKLTKELNLLNENHLKASKNK